MAARESFVTSGTRIKVRFFAGADLPGQPADPRALVEQGYKSGVPMGGTISGAAKSPTFTVWASKDPDGANLDRIQIIKGWVDAKGEPQDKVFDVAWSGDRKPGSNGKVPAVGNTVDLQKATYTNAIGSVELMGVWTDHEFDPKQHAIYYVRVLEIPTPRFTTYDAVRNNLPLLKDVPATIQERAWSFAHLVHAREVSGPRAPRRSECSPRSSAVRRGATICEAFCQLSRGIDSRRSWHCCSFSVAGPVNAQRGGAWDHLGTKEIEGRVDHDKIKCHGKDTYRALQFRVSGAAVQFDRVWSSTGTTRLAPTRSACACCPMVKPRARPRRRGARHHQRGVLVREGVLGKEAGSAVVRKAVVEAKVSRHFWHSIRACNHDIQHPLTPGEHPASRAALRGGDPRPQPRDRCRQPLIPPAVRRRGRGRSGQRLEDLVAGPDRPAIAAALDVLTLEDQAPRRAASGHCAPSPHHSGSRSTWRDSGPSRPFPTSPVSGGSEEAADRWSTAEPGQARGERRRATRADWSHPQPGGQQPWPPRSDDVRARGPRAPLGDPRLGTAGGAGRRAPRDDLSGTGGHRPERREPDPHDREPV